MANLVAPIEPKLVDFLVRESGFDGAEGKRRRQRFGLATQNDDSLWGFVRRGGKGQYCTHGAIKIRVGLDEAFQEGFTAAGFDEFGEHCIEGYDSGMGFAAVIIALIEIDTGPFGNDILWPWSRDDLALARVAGRIPP